MPRSRDIVEDLRSVDSRTRAIETGANPLRRQPYLGYNSPWRNLAVNAGWQVIDTVQWRSVADHVIVKGRVRWTSAPNVIVASLPADVTPSEDTPFSLWATDTAISTISVPPPPADRTLITGWIRANGQIQLPMQSLAVVLYPMSVMLRIEGG